mmetsp:Transcript_26439/g.40600  ORF Transcript_26439/g.40600 Transcript_26439/m.40600 type:complete len:149 (+) Transcript_26439:363-809(+)
MSVLLFPFETRPKRQRKSSSQIQIFTHCCKGSSVLASPEVCFPLMVLWGEHMHQTGAKGDMHTTLVFVTNPTKKRYVLFIPMYIMTSRKLFHLGQEKVGVVSSYKHSKIERKMGSIMWSRKCFKMKKNDIHEDVPGRFIVNCHLFTTS